MQRLVEAAQLGLSPAPIKQHFHLIPRNIKGKLTCTSIIGYRGYLYMALLTDMIEDIGAEVVYKDEVDPSKPFFDRITGDVNHSPDPFRETDPNKFYGVYAWAKLKGRTRLVTHALSMDEVRKRRAKAGTDKFWSEWPLLMVKKTAIKALLNSGFIPLGEKMDRAAQVEKDQEELLEVEDAKWSDANESGEVTPIPAEIPRPTTETRDVIVGKVMPAGSESADGDLFFDEVTQMISVLKNGMWSTPNEAGQEALYEEAVAVMRDKIPDIGSKALEKAGDSIPDIKVTGWGGRLDNLSLRCLVLLETALATTEGR